MIRDLFENSTQKILLNTDVKTKEEAYTQFVKTAMPQLVKRGSKVTNIGTNIVAIENPRYICIIDFNTFNPKDKTVDIRIVNKTTRKETLQKVKYGLISATIKTVMFSVGAVAMGAVGAAAALYDRQSPVGEFMRKAASRVASGVNSVNSLKQQTSVSFF